MWLEYSRVKLVTDKYEDEGGHRGMIGYIIEVYGEGYYEVEFSDASTGTTLAQLVVSQEDLVLFPEMSSN
nr:DUF4926 domain-containing protein [uncultured Desulfobulbus sp.]